jgi:hypothetical protein
MLRRKYSYFRNEVEAVLRDFNLSDKMDEVRAWYNGYRFGDTMIYNPWSFINFVSRPHEGCQPHWVNTASNRILGEAIADADGILQQELEFLLSGETVEMPRADDYGRKANSVAIETFLPFKVLTPR